MSPCLQIELDHAVQFIRARMNRYRRDKEPARMFFPGDLIQFLAWESGLPVNDAQMGHEE